MFNYSKKISNHEEEPNFYVSFTDLSLALLIVFILLTVLIVAYNNEKNSKLEKGIERFKVRENIAEILKETFKNDNTVEIDEKTGVVTIKNGNVEFIGDSYILINKNKTNEFLNNFVPKYLKALKENKEYYKYVKNIVIEGHTARVDSDLAQMDLSLKRAFVIYQIIYNNKNIYNINDNDIIKIEAVGRGSQQLKNPYDYLAQENRRVEFHFVLDEAKLIEDYNKTLKDKNDKD